ncbi:MAG: sugar phosphate isomerase/epimerase [Anaerolineaceae bacterium]|nr:sugar phosphate isomerase/epimerase [Anaerolineaceae bacterium]
MTKLGVITDGISRDLERALDVMNEYELEYAELQFIGAKEVGDLDEGETAHVASLLAVHGVRVSCISRHIFAGLSLEALETDDAPWRAQLAALRRCIAFAQRLDCPLVRVMSFRKEMILFGGNGAEEWVVADEAWGRLVKRMAPAVRIAEQEGITLVVETGNNAMIHSAWLGRKLIEELGSRHLRLLWDPANSLYGDEPAWPDGYAALSGEAESLLGHLHIKDVQVCIPRARVDCAELGTGDMAPHLPEIARELKRDGYSGVISLESVYRPSDGCFEDGFRVSVGTLKRLFG